MLTAPFCYYLIISHLNGMALDVDRARTAPGTLIFPWPINGAVHQQWYDHPASGTIRSRLGPNLCMDIIGGRLALNRCIRGKHSQQWVRRGHVIASRIEHNVVLDIFENDKRARAKVIKHQANHGLNQQWTFSLV